VQYLDACLGGSINPDTAKKSNWKDQNGKANLANEALQLCGTDDDDDDDDDDGGDGGEYIELITSWGYIQGMVWYRT
jgi:hypothetical protein